METEREVTKESTDGGERVTERISAESTHKGVFRASYLVYYILGLVEVLLGLRLIFKLLGANSASGFVALVYSLTRILIAPFVAIFPVATTEGVTTTAVLEPATIIAMIVYALIAWGIAALVQTLLVGKE